MKFDTLYEKYMTTSMFNFKPIKSIDELKIGDVVHCGHEIAIIGTITNIDKNDKSIEVESFDSEESFVFPIDEVHEVHKGPMPLSVTDNIDLDDEDEEEPTDEPVKTTISLNDIRPGDLVNFGAHGDLYVLNTTAGLTRAKWWVTDVEKDRGNPNAAGWFIEPSYAVEIINKYVPTED